MKTKLQTRHHVDALAVPPGQPNRPGQWLYWDDGEGALTGFGVRVTSNGRKAYVVQARVNGASRRVVIGPCNVVPIAEARKKAQKLLTTLSVDQVDVSAQARAARTEAKAQVARSTTLAQVTEQYIDERRVRDLPLKDSSKRDIRRHVLKNFGDWADKAIGRIDHHMVQERFNELHARAPGQAKQAMGILRALLNFARRKRIISAANVVSDALERQLRPAEGRERMVPLDKVRAVWAMLRKRAELELVDSPARTGLDVVSFGLLTGCRLGEAQNLTWDLLDLKEGTWKITAEVAKDRKARTLPLSKAAVELLRQREPRPGNPYVFFGRTIKGAPHIERADGALAHVSRIAGLHLSFHDLRRTWQAVADECGIEAWRSALLSSHAPSTVTGKHYRQKYDVRHLRKDIEAIGEWMMSKSSGTARA